LGIPLRLSLDWRLLLPLLCLPLLAYALWGGFEPPAFLGRWHRSAYARLSGLSPLLRGAGLGLLTPLLPCGLLYAAAGFSLGASSAGVAALWMLSFAAGTLPLLALSQSGFKLAQGRPGLSGGIRRGAAALAALSLIATAILS
jgi:sulfite exporter TauE/SafE